MALVDNVDALLLVCRSFRWKFTLAGTEVAEVDFFFFIVTLVPVPQVCPGLADDFGEAVVLS